MLTTSLRRSLIPLLAVAAVAAAKEPTRKLIITRGNLAGLVEITDSATLALANVYAGNFLDTTKAFAPAPSALPRYQVTFYLPDDRGWWQRLWRRPRLRVAYVVYFTPDDVRHQNYVYLPGAGDTWAAWNHGVIVRADREGHWSYASPAWGERIATAIARARHLPAPSCPVSDSMGLIRSVDSVFHDVQALTGVLETHGIHVLCAYHNTFDGMQGAPAAGIQTSLGGFAVLFFPAPAGAEAVTMTSTVRDGQLLTVLRGPNRQRPVDSLYGADKTDFLVHKRWLFDTFGQTALRSALATALGS